MAKKIGFYRVHKSYMRIVVSCIFHAYDKYVNPPCRARILSRDFKLSHSKRVGVQIQFVRFFRFLYLNFMLSLFVLVESWSPPKTGKNQIHFHKKPDHTKPAHIQTQIIWIHFTMERLMKTYMHYVCIELVTEKSASLRSHVQQCSRNKFAANQLPIDEFKVCK